VAAKSDTPSDSKKTKEPGYIARTTARIKGLFVVRVLQFYQHAQGALLANGLANQALFALFAALWVGFSVAGLIIAGNPRIQQALIELIANAIPGLIKSSSTPNGAINPKVLLDAGVFSWTAAIALVGVLVTALGWLASARVAIRVILGVPQLTTNFLILKAKDLLLALGFGVLLLASAVLSIAGSAATGFLLGLVGIDDKSVFATIVGRVLTLALMFALDAVVLGGLFRILSGVRIPIKRLRGGVLVGALGLGVLKVLAGSLLGVSKSNPLLASFAVILGLLIFLNFVCQVILISASWVAVGITDRGLPIDPVAEAKRLEDERREREAREAAEAANRHGLARLFHRKPKKKVSAPR
jgi:membrane protein